MALVLVQHGHNLILYMFSRFHSSYPSSSTYSFPAKELMKPWSDEHNDRCQSALTCSTSWRSSMILYGPPPLPRASDRRRGDDERSRVLFTEGASAPGCWGMSSLPVVGSMLNTTINSLPTCGGIVTWGHVVSLWRLIAREVSSSIGFCFVSLCTRHGRGRCDAVAKCEGGSVGKVYCVLYMTCNSRFLRMREGCKGRRTYYHPAGCIAQCLRRGVSRYREVSAASGVSSDKEQT